MQFRKDIIDLSYPARKANPLIYPIMYGILGVFMLGKKVKIVKHNMEKAEWPYIAIQTHASFFDFIENYLVTKPHHTTYITSLEELVGREWLMRNAGCFPKRKYIKDTITVRQSIHSIKDLNTSVTIFPEARFNFMGVRERIDGSMAKLAKKVGRPIVVILCHGNFLDEPQFDKKHKRHIPFFELEVTCIASKEEVENLSIEELNERIDKAFQFNEYEWAYQNGLIVKSKYRAHNIHKPLYKCPHCGKDYVMNSNGTELWCESCGAHYHMDETLHLTNTNGETIFSKPYEWYNWEREEVRKEVEAGNYHFEANCRLEHLDNAAKGYNPIGNVHFTHDYSGIHLKGILDNGEEFVFDKKPEDQPSIHIEYLFNKKGTKVPGKMIDINTINDTWAIYPDVKEEVLTKIHFATEALYDKTIREKGLINLYK